jgi:hypothetical protein
MKTKAYFLSYLIQFFLEWKMFQTEAVEKIKTHILCSITCLSKIVPFIRKFEKKLYSRHATDDNMAHVHCMLDT